jgi:hypothetical protein
MNVPTTTTAELNLLFSRYTDAREAYDSYRLVSNQKHAQMKKLEQQLIETIKLSGLERYSVPELGSISLVQSMVFPTPKSNEDKEALFGYIREEYGEDALLAYTSINFQALNFFLRTEYEKFAEQNEAKVIPGVESPTVRETLRFNKPRNK